jgi:hypothetical protein
MIQLAGKQNRLAQEVSPKLFSNEDSAIYMSPESSLSKSENN